jgi:hypothetical protein
MAISGDERVGQSFLFHTCYTKGGGDSVALFWFYAQVMQLVGGELSWGPILLRIDNLNIYKHPMIIHLIYSHGYCVVFIAPYKSCDGSIEYVFSTLQTRL